MCSTYHWPREYVVWGLPLVVGLKLLRVISADREDGDGAVSPEIMYLAERHDATLREYGWPPS